MIFLSMGTRTLRAVLALAVTATGAAAIPGTSRCEIIRVRYAGTIIGDIDVSLVGTGSGAKVQATFEVTGDTTLEEAALRCGNHHFNWYQIVTWSDHDALPAVGDRLTYPWVDPPPGGYLDDPTVPGSVELRWADQVPLLYDEGPDPPPGTPGWQDGFNVSDIRLSERAIGFQSRPLAINGKILSYKTWLVAVRSDGSDPVWLGGFGWEWVRDRIANFKVLCDSPCREEYEDLVEAP